MAFVLIHHYLVAYINVGDGTMYSNPEQITGWDVRWRSLFIRFPSIFSVWILCVLKIDFLY